MSDLEMLVDDPDFPTYLQIFWEGNYSDFAHYSFSDRLIDAMLQHPECFQTLSQDKQFSVRSALTVQNKNPRLFRFIARAVDFDLEEWINRELMFHPTTRALINIIQLDPSKLYRCLNISIQLNSDNWFTELLELCSDLPQCPLTLEQINDFSPKYQCLIVQWMQKRGFAFD